MMTYEEVMEFALAHYCEGGDATYECVGKRDYERMIAEGYMFTKENLLRDFALEVEMQKEYANY